MPELEIDENVVDEKPVETKVNPVTAVLLVAVAALGTLQGVDMATADAQKDAVVAEYVKERMQPYDSVIKNDAAVFVAGQKRVVPAEDIFRPNIIIDSNHILTAIIRDETTGKIWHKATIRATDSTGRLDFNFRIQPCPPYILNADTIPDIKE